MPFKLQHFNNNLRIGLWSITESESELQDQWQLPWDVQSAAPARRIEWLASRLCLKELLGESFELYKDEFGKPHLKDKAGFISITHCPGYAAAAYHHDCAIGLDMESINKRILNIAARFIREDEHPVLEEFGELKGAYFIWSAKESLFKLYGRKSLNFKNHLKIYKAGDSWYASLYKGQEMRNIPLHYHWMDNHILTWMYDEA